MTTTFDFASPLGTLRYSLDELEHVVGMGFVEGPIGYPTHSPLASALTHYFMDHRPIHWPVQFTTGTPFQRDVWNALLTIPYGHVVSYRDIAKQIGRPLAVRAVGQACKKNPIGLVVPCHRVIGANGALTGYSGKGFIHLKEALLQHEKTSGAPLV